MIRVLELFGGIGACSKALERLNIPHEIVDYVEIDKYAVQSFNAIHGTSFEPQDITKWDKDIKVDLIMHGSPCQDFSVAGLGKGGDKGSGTRSSLMYETLRIVEKLKPKYVIWENVKNLLSAKHKPNFDAYQKAMEDLGYKNFYQVLNAKDFGVPQNRERVFTVSIRREKKMSGMSDPVFQFPDTMPLTKRLKDILDDKVDESFYLSDDRVKKIKLWEKRQRENGRDFRFEPLVPEAKVENPLKGKTGYGWHFEQQVYDKDGIARTVKAGGGSGNIPKIIDDTYANRDPREYEQVSPTLRAHRSGLRVAEPFVVASRGRNPNNPSDRTTGSPTEQRLEPKFDGTTNTLTSVQKDNYIATPYRIRKLTPKECWRLMGFDDIDFEKAKASGVSNTQLYKQAGNSIVVNVLEAILSNLLQFYRTSIG